MPTIKFSHVYDKLINTLTMKPFESARLLQVVLIESEKLSRPFLDYDTNYGKYELSDSRFYMMLIFQRPDGGLFTTLRSQFNLRGNKLPYYEGLVGQEFKIVINENKRA